MYSSRRGAYARNDDEEDEHRHYCCYGRTSLAASAADARYAAERAGVAATAAADEAARSLRHAADMARRATALEARLLLLASEPRTTKKGRRTLVRFGGLEPFEKKEEVGRGSADESLEEVVSPSASPKYSAVSPPPEYLAAVPPLSPQYSLHSAKLRRHVRVPEAAAADSSDSSDSSDCTGKEALEQQKLQQKLQQPLQKRQRRP